MRRPERGFTLIELVIVLFILGILAGYAVLSIGNRSLDAQIETEARRLEKLIELAGEEAELQGIEIGLRFEDNRYRFLTTSPEGVWAPMDAKGSLRERSLPQPLALKLKVEGRDAKTSKDEDGERPQLIRLSSGEATAFVLELRAIGFKGFYQLEGDALGRLKLEYKEKTS